MNQDPDRTDPPRERATDSARARKKAMDYLARREHGRRELEAKLEAAGFAAETAAAAVERLRTDGLQDDRRFVEAFLRSRIGQGKGPVRIRLELERHGVDGPLVDECLQSAGEDWTALARSIRARKFGAGHPRDFREKARQMRFLQYRGFENEQVRRALVDDETD